MKLNPLPFRLVPPPWLVSAALLVGTAVLCVRSRSRSDILGFFTPSGHLQAIASDRDGLLLFFSEVPFGREAAWSADYMSASADEFQDAHALLYGASKTKKPHESHFAGFRCVRDQLSPTPTIAWWYRAITIPYWFLILLFAILPLQRLQRWVVRSRRLRRGWCPACGYDLRHSGERCPECGRGTGSRSTEGPNAVEPTSVAQCNSVVAVALLLLGIGVMAAALIRGSHLESRAFRAENRINTLDQKLRDIDGWVESYSDFVNQIKDASPIPIVQDPNPTPLPDGGAERLMELHLHGVSVTAGLSAILSLFDPPPDERYRDGAIHLSSTDCFARAYPIDFLLRQLDLEGDKRSNHRSAFGNAQYASAKSLGQYHAITLIEQFTGIDVFFRATFGNRLVVVATGRGQAALHVLLRTYLTAVLSDSPPTRPVTEDMQPVDHSSLERKVPELKLTSSNLVVALESLQQQTQSNLIIDWHSLADAGVDWRRPVKIQLWDTTVGRALDAIFSSVGYGDAVGVNSRNGIIFVGARSQTPVADIRVYDVRDLIAQTVQYNQAKGPDTRARVINQMGPSRSPDPQPSVMQDAIDSLIQSIEDSVDMDSWRDNGGSVGSIRELGGRLIIAQTPRAHVRIAEFLRTLRAGGSKEGMRIQDAPQTQPSRP